MNNLVTINQNNQAITTSLMVAETFNKQHKNIIQAIQKLEIPQDFNRLNFQPVKYVDKKGEERPMYEITRDGFTLLAMGFTGSKAMEFKIKYINAFNEMADIISSQRPEEEIDDICLEYDTNNIQVAEFELRAIKVIHQLFGRDAAKQAYMSSKYLPRPTFAIDGKHSTSALACLEYLKTILVSHYPLSKLISHKCTDILKSSGFDIIDDMLCIATSSKAAAQHFADSRWANNWVATLLELPHAERGRAAKRFAGITAKYIMVPTFYFREPVNVRN